MARTWPTHRVKAANRNLRHRWLLKQNGRARRTPAKNRPTEPQSLI